MNAENIKHLQDLKYLETATSFRAPGSPFWDLGSVPYILRSFKVIVSTEPLIAFYRCGIVINFAIHLDRRHPLTPYHLCSV